MKEKPLGTHRDWAEEDVIDTEKWQRGRGCCWGTDRGRECFRGGG